MATNVNVTTVKNVNTVKLQTSMTPATSTTVGASESFSIAIDAADDRFFIIIDNREGAGNINCTIPAGLFEGGAFTKCGNLPKGSLGYLFVDSIKSKVNGSVQITLAPTSVSSLENVKVGAVQFVPVTNN